VADWDAGHYFGYVVVDITDGSARGGTGLHTRIGEHGHGVGGWRRVDAGGRGLVTTFGAALTRVTFTLEDVQRVEMRCDEANVASAAVPRRLGFTLERIEDKPILAPGEIGRAMIWTCRPGQLREPQSPADG
jgi:RimJ/RimL family protein N-acetyltransferase